MAITFFVGVSEILQATEIYNCSKGKAYIVSINSFHTNLGLE